MKVHDDPVNDLPDDVKVTLYDSEGKQVGEDAEYINGIYMLTIPSLPPGRYQFSVKAHDNSKTHTYLNPDKPVEKLLRLVAVKSTQPVQNGITVGEPKYFDVRDLQQHMRVIQASLAQTKYPDASALFSDIERVQGITNTGSASAVGVQSTPLPSIVTTTGGTNTKTVTQSAIIPSIPLATPPTASTNYQGQSGLSPLQILTQQTSLEYELTNLQLLLNGALSDRLAYLGHPVDGHPSDDVSDQGFASRSQAVLGFNITVAPECDKAIAEVEISIDTIQADDVHTVFGNDDRPNLVMQLPQERSYNVATIQTDSKATSFGAVVTPLNIGASQTKNSQSLYLVQDTDTVALQRIPADPADSRENAPPLSDGLHLVWQFRPVLGQAAVESGSRQVFAQMALPVDADGLWMGCVTAVTRWRHYNAKTGVVGDVIPGTENVQTFHQPVAVPPKSATDAALAPSIQKLDWQDAGDGMVLVNVEGRNFLPDTQVILGQQTMNSATSGLYLQGETRLSFLTSAQQLAYLQIPAILNSYGTTRVVQPSERVIQGEINPCLQIVSAIAEPIDDKNATVTVDLIDPQTEAAPEFAAELNKDKPSHQLIMAIGNSVFGLSNSPIGNNELKTDNGSNSIYGKYKSVRRYTFNTSMDLLRANPYVRVVDPLYGPRYVADSSIDLAGDFGATTATILPTTRAGFVDLLIPGQNFNSDTTVKIGDITYPDQGSKPIMGNEPDTNSKTKSQHQMRLTKNYLHLLNIEASRFIGVKSAIVIQTYPEPSLSGTVSGQRYTVVSIPGDGFGNSITPTTIVAPATDKTYDLFIQGQNFSRYSIVELGGIQFWDTNVDWTKSAKGKAPDGASGSGTATPPVGASGKYSMTVGGDGSLIHISGLDSTTFGSVNYAVIRDYEENQSPVLVALPKDAFKGSSIGTSGGTGGAGGSGNQGNHKLSPKVDSTIDSSSQAVKVTKNSDKYIEVKGTNLNGIVDVRFDKTSIEFTLKDNNTLEIRLTPLITGTKGDKGIDLYKSDGSFVPVIVTVQ